MRRAAAPGDPGQGGFGFAPSMGDARPASKVVRLARGDLFYMVDSGDGWQAYAPAFVDGAEVRRRAEDRFAGSVVVVVDGSEIGTK